MSLRMLSGEIKGPTNEPDAPILDGHEYTAGATGTSCALNGTLYGLDSAVCWGHVKLVCTPGGWTRAGECGHGND